MIKIGQKTWTLSAKENSQGRTWQEIGHNSLTLSPVTMKLDRQVRTVFRKRSTKAFCNRTKGGAKNAINVFLKKKHNKEIWYIWYALGAGINQNLMCHIDWCKWAWPLTYLLITKNSYQLNSFSK